jgi:hypothetical protein
VSTRTGAAQGGERAPVEGAGGVLASHAHFEVGLCEHGSGVVADGRVDLRARKRNVLAQRVHRDVRAQALRLLLPEERREVPREALVVRRVCLQSARL